MPWVSLDRRRQDYQRRVANHRCTGCGVKLPETYRWKACEVCKASARQYNNTWRKEKRLEPSEAPGARCPVCCLLEPHACIQGNAEARRGPGLVYPEGQ